MAETGIEWTDLTWNPVTGCDKVSPGCARCYAERMSERLKLMGHPKYGNAFALTLQPDTLELPLRWRKPRSIFVNSMSDLFHEGVPEAYIGRVFEVMRRAHWHRFQVLTKRADRLAELAPAIDWPPNVWMGVSVESAAYAWRVDRLRSTGARVKFLSIEPLLGPIPDLDLTGIDWAIVGGESGPGARPMEEAWVLEILARARASGAAFFFKQWGGPNKKKAGRLLGGRTYDERPGPA